VSDRGFTLVELLISMAITATTAGALVSLLVAGQSIARLQPEAADLQQRARIATQVIGTELARAGAGLDAGPAAGPLSRRFAPVSPSADGGLTIWYVSEAAGQATLAAPLERDAVAAAIALQPACGGSASGCGLVAGTTALLFDDVGCHDVARIEAADGDSLTLRPATRTCAYVAGSAIARGEVRTYRVDPAQRHLLRRDEATGLSVPVIDNVDAMAVEHLDSGGRIRVTLRFLASVATQAPPLVVTLDTRPPNLQVR